MQNSSSDFTSVTVFWHTQRIQRK